MNARIALFCLLQAGVAVYAFMRGGRSERFAAAATSAALLIGFALPFDAWTSYRHLEIARLAVDGSLALALIALAVRSNRYWPLWTAAVQLIAVGIHIITAIDHPIAPVVYAGLVNWLGYPILALMWGGTWRRARRDRPKDSLAHRRQRS